MALRRFNKIMKPVATVGIIGFILASVYGMYSYLRQNVFVETPDKKIIAEVNGAKISEVEFVRAYQTLKSQLDNFTLQKQQSAQGVEVKPLPDEVVEKYVLQNIIDKKLLLSESKKLKVKINSSEIDKIVKDSKSQFPNDDEFNAALRAQGLNLGTYKKNIKEEVTIKKVQEKLQESVKVNDAELKKIYDRYKYADFDGQTFNEAKNQIKELYIRDNSGIFFNSYLNKLRDSAKIKFKDEKYSKLYESSNKVVYEKEGYKYIDRMVNERIIAFFANTQNGYSEENVKKIEEQMKLELEKLIAISKKAVSAGIKQSDEYYGLDKLSDQSKRYYDYLIDSYKANDSEMKQIFESNKSKYNIKHSVSGNIVGDVYKPGSKESGEARNKAEELLKTLTDKNFAEKAKANSEDPGSKENGGSLGWADLTQLVPEFAAAVKTTPKGKISSVVQTQFGYHIIYVEDKDPKNENRAKVSHILIMPKVSDSSKSDLENRIKKLKVELDSKKINWNEVNTQQKYNYEIKEQFKKVLENAPIPGIGYDSEANKQLFAAKIGENVIFKNSEGVFLMTKLSERQSKEVTFEEVKERIRLELAFKKANDLIESIK